MAHQAVIAIGMNPANRNTASTPASALRDFLASEAAGGIILMVVAALALTIANSPLADRYFHFIHAVTGPVLSPKLGPMTVHLWINDGLMAIFFLLVGLEIKREFVNGHLATWADRLLPMIAAAAGMALPAAVYLFMAGGDPALVRGWAIPAATDIAFAIGVLALLGSRAPASLKLFLTTVAIVNDMGAVAIIALFYTTSLDLVALGAAVLIWLAMLAMGRLGVARLWPYLILAALLWYATLLSGVHATIAGVLAAFAIPLRRSIATPDAETHCCTGWNICWPVRWPLPSSRFSALPMQASRCRVSGLTHCLRRFRWESRWGSSSASRSGYMAAFGFA